LGTHWERFGNAGAIGPLPDHHPDYVFHNHYFIKKYKSILL
jgi:hypothetical protein